MPRPGLMLKVVLLLLLVFGAAYAALSTLYVPVLQREIQGEMSRVAHEFLAKSEAVMRARARHIEGENLRKLEDLPFELTDGDPAATRRMVKAYAAGFGKTYTKNADLVSEELQQRMAGRIDDRAKTLAGEFRSEAVEAIVILLAVLLAATGLTLARTVLFPLGRLLRATEALAGGNLGERAGIKGADEVGRLGRAFDRMAAALQTSRSEIEGLNATLAEKVEEKTRALADRNRELAAANEKLRATIEELTTTRDALVHSETMASLGTLAGGVAHEFNNLLGGIIGCAEDAASETDPEAVSESLDMILRTARRACNITENLLRFSRPPTRKPRSADLAAIVSDALSLIGPEAVKRGVTIEADLEPGAKAIVDPGQIHQVVLNLVTNALHAMPHGGTLTATVQRGGGKATVSVKDTGKGIPKANLSRVFDPFFTTRETGTGLGLSVSYSIVKAHGGTLAVSSLEGKGSEFTVELPAEKE